MITALSLKFVQLVFPSRRVAVETAGGGNVEK